MSSRIQDLIDNKTILQSNNSGPFIIIKDLGRVNGRNRVIIRFINTGYECDVLSFNAINHRVKDHTLQSQSNDFNSSRIDDYNKYINDLLKVIYMHMIDRCYNVHSEKYQSYGGIGVTVCDRWKNDINAFLIDAQLLYGFDKFYNNPHQYQLDKDYMQHFIPKQYRKYSKETCIFLYNQDNSNLRIIEQSYNDRMYGIEINSAGNYYVRIKINGKRMVIGTFDDATAAANAFNYWQLYFHNYELIPLLNNVPYMTPNEFIKHNVRTKEICKIVDAI